MSEMKITENVYLVGSAELSGGGDCMVYAIAVGKDEVCLIDAGTENADAILANIQTTPLGSRKIAHLILTHCHFDHIGAAHQFKRLCPGLKVYAHSWDREAIEGKPHAEAMTAASWYGSTLIPVKVDVVFTQAREVINLGGTHLTILHIPGHTPGSIAITVKDEGKLILFAQDVHGPFVAEFKSNIQDWANSMKMLLALEADILCEGHYGIYPEKERAKKFIESQLKANGF
jgi:glyoxylase-like metal-dependent hydrolase (beta-lactamase superfamily II)